MIDIYINKADASASHLETLTTGMSEVVYVRFNLSHDWKGLKKTAVFTNGETTVSVIEEAWQTSDSCAVPATIFSIPGKKVLVGLQGTDASGTILPAVMVSIGGVVKGTEANNDPSTDPTLPIWEQLRQKIDNASRFCSVRLEKNPKDTIYDCTTLRVWFEGKENIPSGAEIHLYRAVRRREARFHWVHPLNYDASKTNGETYMGYGLLAGHYYEYNTSGEQYPPVPDWMPHEGLMQTEYPISAIDMEHGYIDIPIGRDYLPLLKPLGLDCGWETVGVMGVSPNSVAPLLFRYRIVKDGKPIDIPGDCLRFGISESFSQSTLTEFLCDGHLNSCALFLKIS